MVQGIDDSLPPRKRQRMAGPEGFQKPPVTPVKVNVPTFVSGFGKPTSRPTSMPKSVKPVSTSRTLPVFKPLSESGSKSVISKSNSTNKPIMRSKPLSTPDLKARTRPNYDIHHLHAESKPVGRRLQPPSLVEVKSEDTNTPPMRKVTLPSFAQPPVTPSKPTVSLNTILPPQLPTPTAREQMHPISKTTIARATDLTTDQGTAELASIFLRDQHPDISNQAKDPDDVNGFWMGVSPEKGGRNTKGKGKEKFIRNGLAAQASALFTRSHNSLALWQKEIEIRLSSSHLVPPNLRARIVKISDMPLGISSRSPSKPKVSTSSASTSRGVALCQILSVNPTKTTDSAHLLPRKKDKQHHLIILSFPSSAPSRASHNRNRPHVRNPDDFIEGRELHIWEPWQEVFLGSKTSSLKEEEEVGMSISPFPLLPSSFPFSPSPARTPIPVDTRVADVALLCSRFRILRED